MLKVALLTIKLGTQQERKEQKGKKDTMVVDSVVLRCHGKRVPSRYWFDQDACLMVST